MGYGSVALTLSQCLRRLVLSQTYDITTLSAEYTSALAINSEKSIESQAAAQPWPNSTLSAQRPHVGFRRAAHVRQ